MKSIGQISCRWITIAGVMLVALGAAGLVPWRVIAQTLGNAESVKAGAEATNRESEMRLKQLGRALLMYMQDYYEVQPPMRDAATVKKLLLPYVRKNELIFVQPGTDDLYQPNRSLSSRRVYSSMTIRRSARRQGQPETFIAVDGTRRAHVVAYYEPTPGPDGMRGVLFLDGHVARVSPAEWQRLKRSSNIH